MSALDLTMRAGVAMIGQLALRALGLSPLLALATAGGMLIALTALAAMSGRR